MGVVPLAPFEPLSVEGESITLQTEGKILVLPTGDPDVLPLFNEDALNPNRLTISESPFGGIKGSFSDGCVGTILVNSGDGIYLQDPNGENTSKELGAGKLYELGCLQVDTGANTITEDFYIVNNSAVDTWADIEIYTPNYLVFNSQSVKIYSHDGISFFSLQGIVIQGDNSSGSFNNSRNDYIYFLDGSTLDSYVGDPDPKFNHTGLSGFGIGVRNQVKTDCTYGGYRQITYSSNYGGKYRVGFSLLMPALNESYPNRNKIRLKLVVYYNVDSDGHYSSTYEFSESDLQNLSHPWIGLYESTSNTVNFFLSTYRPKQFSFKKDENGNIYELTLDPGNGMLYHGQIIHSNLILDSNSDSIPDCLDSAKEGSLAKLLQQHGMIEW